MSWCEAQKVAQDQLEEIVEALHVCITWMFSVE